MVCAAELRGLGAEADARRLAPGSIVAISTDEDERLDAWRESMSKAFAFVADPGKAAIGAWGLVHPGAAPGGRDAARPATYVVGRDLVVAWAHPAQSVLDRPEPAAVLDALAAAR